MISWSANDWGPNHLTPPMRPWTEVGWELARGGGGAPHLSDGNEPTSLPLAPTLGNPTVRVSLAPSERLPADGGSSPPARVYDGPSEARWYDVELVDGFEADEIAEPEWNKIPEAKRATVHQRWEAARAEKLTPHWVKMWGPQIPWYARQPKFQILSVGPRPGGETP